MIDQSPVSAWLLYDKVDEKLLFLSTYSMKMPNSARFTPLLAFTKQMWMEGTKVMGKE